MLGTKRSTLAAAVLGFGMLLANTSPLRADIVVTFDSAVQQPSGVFTYTYDVFLAPSSELHAGGLFQNSMQLNANQLVGNGFTLYDVQGFVPGSLVILAPMSGLFDPAAVVMQGTGLTPFAQSPPDNPALGNITFIYTAPFEIENFPGGTNLFLGQFQFDSTGAPEDTLFYAAATQKEVADPIENDQIANNTSVTIGPSGIIPEPSTLALLGMGLPVFAALAWRRRTKMV